ncbi:MAG TPA: DUF3644 domain-containing protein [Ktedonobacterales bacterium]
MKKEAKILLDKAIDSLVLSVEHFNRPWDQGRPEAVLILLDHAFEMLLKACILQLGGRIRKKDARQTIGFDECVRKGLTGRKRFLVDEQALLLQSINSLRDAAQHHIVSISEQHLYIHCQAGLTLFNDLLDNVFTTKLHIKLPERVLPLSTRPPTNLVALFEHEVKEIEQLLLPGKRRKLEALSRLRGLAIVDSAMRGEKLQPSDSDLAHIIEQIQTSKPWDQIFPGVAAIDITSNGYGPSLDLQITKGGGIAVTLVPEGTPGASIVAVRRVNELGFYNLSHKQLAQKVGLTQPKTTAIIRYLGLNEDPDCATIITIGGSKFQRYSQKALTRLSDAAKTLDIEQIWATHGAKGTKKKKVVVHA